MAFINEYGLFLFKTLTLVVAILICFAGLISISRKDKPKLELTPINQEYNDLKTLLKKEMGLKDKKEKRKTKKSLKIAEKARANLYVIDFNGDIKASQVEQLRQEITAILAVAQPNDQVLVRLESPGGAVNGYGLAAAQLQRIRDHQLNLTISIDKIAASGGYLMACLAHKIIASPFAIIGSIGVVAQIPNFHRLLKKHDVDIELLTAGEYKRTLTLFGENTKQGREKFQQDLQAIHDQFKAYVLSFRQSLDIEKVATGEHWLGQEALTLKLVDHLQTSDTYIVEQMQNYNVYKLKIRSKESLAAKLAKPAMKLLHPWA